MTLFYALRGAASYVSPVAFGALKHQRFIHSAVRSVFRRREITKAVSLVPNREATSISPKKYDENLLSALDEEIQSVLESHPPKQDVKPEGNIPFKIEDLAHSESITLRRKYGTEEIKVEVRFWGGPRPTDRTPLILTVTFTKGGGPFLEFNCTGSSDEIFSIESVAVKPKQLAEADAVDPGFYEPPPFKNLQEKLQKGFHIYLQERGITPSLSNYLREYLINKDNKEYTHWLRNVKEFVEK